jgi:myosin heavy subunit
MRPAGARPAVDTKLRFSISVTFNILNDSLTAIQNQPFVLEVSARGSVVPEQMSMLINNERYFLKHNGNGLFRHVFLQPKTDVEFTLEANGYTSTPNTLRVTPVPLLTGLTTAIDYPGYTGKKDEILEGTGNITVPQGSRIAWTVATKQTTDVTLFAEDSSYVFNRISDTFSLDQQLFKPLRYEIALSNNFLKNQEKMAFKIDVIPDAYPKIIMEERTDSLRPEGDRIYIGQVSDDYGLKRLQIKYRIPDRDSTYTAKDLKISQGVFDRVATTFPGSFKLEKGFSYEFFFEVSDNDAVHGSKSSRSATFTYRVLSENEEQQIQLQQQKNSIDNFEQGIQELEEQQKSLDELSKLAREKNQLNFNDQKKLQNFIKRQEQQEEMMKQFNRQLDENIKTKDDRDSEFEELLKERLERQQKKIAENEKLLEELQKLGEKINQEELSQRLEELGKQQQNDKRNLKQLLELTKRFYVTSKAEQIQKNLEELADKQESLSQDSIRNNSENQEKLNEEFAALQKEIDSLSKANEQLKDPMELGTDKNLEEEINKEQQEAKENLEAGEKSPAEQPKKESQQNAQKNQKKATDKLRKLSQQMQGSMSMSGAQMLQEDTQMLRQILDNVMLYSFDQEEIMEKLNAYNERNPNFSKELRKQNDLREVFEHIDDSLFSLSLRRPELSEQINKNITDVYYNIDKTLSSFSENQFYQGISHQQYALTAANELADFLSEVLDNMQQQLSGSGSGGQDMQLPDIIKSQEELNQMMNEGQGKSPKDGEGEGENKEGKKNEGKNGKEPQNSGEDGNSEQMSQELYEIYKRQQQIRNALEKQLEELNGEAIRKQATDLIRQMERTEQNLLEQGNTPQNQNRLLQLKHQLLKLEEATQLQGRKKERESNTNTDEFQNNNYDQTPDLQEYFNETEILNRQILPLRQIYKRKVQEYFKNDDRI